MEVRNEETLRKTPGFLAWAVWQVTSLKWGVKWGVEKDRTGGGLGSGEECSAGNDQSFTYSWVNCI